MTNYLHRTPNPWNLAAPPAWFLTELAAYDSEMRIFPSAEEACYRFARKAKVHPAVMQALKNRPDTKTYVEYGLVPVTSLPQFEPWSPRVLFELAERDMHRVGGGAKAADILDAAEDRREQAARAKQSDDLDRMSQEAYIDHTIDAGTRNSFKSHGGPLRTLHTERQLRGGAMFGR